MNIAISYRFTGEDPLQVKEMLQQVDQILTQKGHTPFIFSKEIKWDETFPLPEIMPLVFSKLRNQDALLAIITNSEKSEGMLLEIGYALANNIPLYLVIKEGIKTTFLQHLAEVKLIFSTLEEMYRKIKEI